MYIVSMLRSSTKNYCTTPPPAALSAAHSQMSSLQGNSCHRDTAGFKVIAVCGSFFLKPRPVESAGSIADQKDESVFSVLDRGLVIYYAACAPVLQFCRCAFWRSPVQKILPGSTPSLRLQLLCSIPQSVTSATRPWNGFVNTRKNTVVK